jgi:hypothetical protein
MIDSCVKKKETFFKFLNTLILLFYCKVGGLAPIAMLSAFLILFIRA